MKWIHILGVIVLYFVLHQLQRHVADIGATRVMKSLSEEGFASCDKYFDDREKLHTQRIVIRKSDIHDLGLFANATIPCGAVIWDAYTLKPLRLLEKTPFSLSLWGITNVFARVNHHHVPSARVVFNRETNQWILYALRDIYTDEEITSDYLDRPYFGFPSYPQWDISTSLPSSIARVQLTPPAWEIIIRLIVVLCKWMIIPGILLL